MQNVIETTGTVKRLNEAIVAPQPNHADIKLVKHGNSKAFALVSIPDYMASALDCKGRTAGEPVSFNAPAGEKNWGKYYAMGLRLVKAGGGFRRPLGGMGSGRHGLENGRIYGADSLGIATNRCGERVRSYRSYRYPLREISAWGLLRSLPESVTNDLGAR